MPTKRKTLPDQSVLQELLHYEPTAGQLFWKNRPEHYFTSKHQQQRWNTVYAGKAAFAQIDSTGYLRGKLFNVIYLTHRIVWKIYHGNEPNVIDHIDGVLTNNQISNLRNVDDFVNAKNKKLNKGNKTGYSGIHKKNTLTDRYEVTIGLNNKKIYVGVFFTLEEAVAARKAAEIQYGYHENHGRAA
jgi:hypothetical protein